MFVQEDSYRAVKNGWSAVVKYYRYGNESSAESSYDYSYKQMELQKKQGEFDGDLKKDGDMFTAKGDLKDSSHEDGIYYVTILAGDTVIFIEEYAKTDDAVKEAEEIIKDLGLCSQYVFELNKRCKRGYLI